MPYGTGHWHISNWEQATIGNSFMLFFCSFCFLYCSLICCAFLFFIFKPYWTARTARCGSDCTYSRAKYSPWTSWASWNGSEAADVWHSPSTTRYACSRRLQTKTGTTLTTIAAPVPSTSTSSTVGTTRVSAKGGDGLRRGTLSSATMAIMMRRRRNQTRIPTRCPTLLWIAGDSRSFSRSVLLLSLGVVWLYFFFISQVCVVCAFAACVGWRPHAGDPETGFSTQWVCRRLCPRRRPPWEEHSSRGHVGH